MKVIVNIASTMKNVADRKENFMKDNIINRLEQELFQFRTELISVTYTAVQLVEEAYQIAVKEHIVESMQLLSGESQSTKNIWDWLNRQERIPDYLYKLWLHSDASLVQELADVLMDEVYYDKEAHNHE